MTSHRYAKGAFTISDIQHAASDVSRSNVSSLDSTWHTILSGIHTTYGNVRHRTLPYVVWIPLRYVTCCQETKRWIDWHQMQRVEWLLRQIHRQTEHAHQIFHHRNIHTRTADDYGGDYRQRAETGAPWQTVGHVGNYGIASTEMHHLVPSLDVS